MKIVLTLWMCLFLGALTASLVACSKDEAGNKADASLLVNGENCNIIDASICFHGRITDSDGEIEIAPHGALTMQVVVDGAWHNFSMSLDGLSDASEVKIGKNLVTDKGVTVYQFRPVTSIELSTRYEDERGCIFINEITEKYLIIDFNTFSFVKDMGSKSIKYTMDGVVKVTLVH